MLVCHDLLLCTWQNPSQAVPCAQCVLVIVLVREGVSPCCHLAPQSFQLLHHHPPASSLVPHKPPICFALNFCSAVGLYVCALRLQAFCKPVASEDCTSTTVCTASLQAWQLFLWGVFVFVYLLAAHALFLYGSPCTYICSSLYHHTIGLGWLTQVPERSLVWMGRCCTCDV